MAKTAAKSAATNSKAKPAAKARAVLRGVALIDAYGMDAVSDHLSNGVTMTAIAAEVGVSVGQLSQWLASDEERSARARESRIHAARVWDEKALEAIEQAGDPFELQRARELAQHFRWRASKTAPKDYGDKLHAEHSGPGGGAIQVESTVTLVRASHVEVASE